jgi:Ca2+-binding EF-hand superfamily protein
MMQLSQFIPMMVRPITSGTMTPSQIRKAFRYFDIDITLRESGAVACDRFVFVIAPP